MKCFGKLTLGALFAASALLPQGVFRLLGPTGGYLMSYPLAAYVTGALADRLLPGPKPVVRSRRKWDGRPTSLPR